MLTLLWQTPRTIVGFAFLLPHPRFSPKPSAQPLEDNLSLQASNHPTIATKPWECLLLNHHDA
jgi:hypothetical protein